MLITKNIKGVTAEFNCEVMRVNPLRPEAVLRCTYEGKAFNAEKLLPEQKAVKFWTPILIGGAKVGGISLSSEDFAALEAEVAAINAAIHNEAVVHAEAIRTGALPITVSWENGEILSGYAVYDMDAARELTRLGVAKEVSGWGCLVDASMVKTLGTSFTVPEVESYTAPVRAEAKQAELAKEAALQQARETAAQTGSPVVLERWTEECDGSATECNLDGYARLMMPDGTIHVKRTHTF